MFLDANTNTYLCLPRGDATLLRNAVTGAEPGPEADALLGEMVALGLIEPAARPEPAFPQIESTAEAEYHDFAAPDLRPDFVSWLRLLCAAVEAWVTLSILSPRRWFRSPCRGSDVAISRACTLALQFDRMRPLIPRSGRCLPKSMLLLGYLRRHGVAATLVFGVRTFPFEAHCWVEYRGAVLNDTLEHVRWYTPIAVA